MRAIFKKEINMFLSSLIGWLVISVFVLATGLFVWIFPDSSVLQYGFADLSVFFDMTPYIFIFLIPAITMRAFAEEYKTGTIELLFTRPLSCFQIVLGKFLAAWFLVGLALLPTLTYYVCIWILGSPQGNIDSASVFGSYAGLMMLASVLVSLGILCSCQTDNQIVAFLVAVFFSFILYAGLASLSRISDLGTGLLEKASLQYHYSAMGKGLIDSRNLLYMFSLMLVFLKLSSWTCQSRRS